MTAQAFLLLSMVLTMVRIARNKPWRNKLLPARWMTVLFCFAIVLAYFTLLAMNLSEDRQLKVDHFAALTSSEHPTTLIEYSYLTEDNASLIQSSARHVQGLFTRAAEAAQKNEVVYATLSSPLLGFLIPKTGSNTVQHYLLEALAAVGQFSNAGCQPPNRNGCMTQPSYIHDTSCHVAFDNHFQPIPLVDAVALAENNPNSKCHRWPSLSLLPGTNALYENVLQQSVCLIALRDPIDRAIAAYYEWHYKRTSPLSAIEYLEKHGAKHFIDLVGGGFQKEHTSPKVWEAVLKSCLVGVTENMDQFATTLSRVLRIPAPHRAVKKRSLLKEGMTENDFKQFYQELTPFMHDDINLWRLAGRISDAQHKVSQSFAPLTTQKLPSKKNKCYYCETCFKEDEPWLGIHWKVFDTPNAQIGCPFDQKACCRPC